MGNSEQQITWFAIYCSNPCIVEPLNKRTKLFCCRENWLDPIPHRSSHSSQNSDDVSLFSKDGHEHILKKPQIRKFLSLFRNKKSTNF